MLSRSEFSDKARADLLIVEEAIKGDERAYATLLEKYYDSIYFLLLKKINNANDAEDLTMETFAKAFNSLQQYKPIYAFSTWLYRIAINNCIDHIRRKGSRPQSMEPLYDTQDHDIHALESASLDPEEKVIKDQRAFVIKKMVKSLKPRYAQLIDLRYYREYSYVEISKEMNIPIGTVKAQLYRARELLYPLINPKSQNF